MPAIRIRTSTGWQDLAIQGPQGPVGPQGPQGIQGPSGVTDQSDLDAIPWRGYSFRMISGEAATGPGTYIRAAQQNNNVYADSDYFQGWLAGNATGIKVMKAGLVKVFATIYVVSGVTAASTMEAGVYLNGSQYLGVRYIPQTTSAHSLVIGPALRVCAVNDLWQFGMTSNGNAYQGTDGRYTWGWLEYLGA